MKKTELLNSRISAVVAEMGHTDQITIADAGLPIPSSVERIDLAVIRGLPTLLSVLKATLSELTIEKVIVASQFQEVSPLAYQEIVTLIHATNPQCEIIAIDHEQFKLQSAQSKAIIRTGESTPYVNIILQSGVSF